MRSAQGTALAQLWKIVGKYKVRSFANHDLPLASNLTATMSSVASETYQKLLLLKGHGLPLYFPDLYDSLPAACCDRGVTIGDVGIITDDGSFDFLFNVSLPSSDPINIGRTPPSFQMVVLNESIDLGSRQCGFPRNSSIISSSIKKIELSVGASVTNA